MKVVFIHSAWLNLYGRKAVRYKLKNSLKTQKMLKKGQIAFKIQTDVCRRIINESNDEQILDSKYILDSKFWVFVKSHLLATNFFVPSAAPASSEFMGKTFQAAQLTDERFLTIDHSCKIFFWYLPN